MKEVVVISGKGGTGKTSLTASLAVLAGQEAILADCDVDAADMHLLLEPAEVEGHEFYSGTVAVVDPDKCIGCGKCFRVCRFKAVREGETAEGESVVTIDPLSCEGCGYCSRVCPSDSITNEPQMVGHWFDSPVKTGTRMVHACLGIGAENSGKLVAQVKNQAKNAAQEEKKELVLVDGSPGVGCPVVSSLSGADFVVLVTEPSASGLHDLQRVHELVKKFKIPAGCLINKADINLDVTREIRDFLGREGILPLGELPYTENFTRAMTQGKTIIEYEEEMGTAHEKTALSPLLNKTWKEIQKL